MQYPKVIFLDAMGTLFGLRTTVGEVYSDLAAQVGVQVSPQSLDKAFINSFKAANPLAFPGVDMAQIPNLEFQWWRAIARSSFAQAGVLEQFEDFGAFFSHLYHYFATKNPWYVYEDVLSALTHWQKQGIELGIISNFDSRLYNVLAELELNQFFSSVTLSSTTGAAKPGQEIFFSALQKHNCHPGQAWHIGDSLKEDYYGAKTAGISAFYLERLS